jgi:hypothetical protein
MNRLFVRFPIGVVVIGAVAIETLGAWRKW